MKYKIYTTLLCIIMFPPIEARTLDPSSLKARSRSSLLTLLDRAEQSKDKELADQLRSYLGITTTTVVLPEAPPGKAWKLVDEGLNEQSMNQIPTSPPPTTDVGGQWVDVEKSGTNVWLYIDTDRNIKNKDGKIVGIIPTNATQKQIIELLSFAMQKDVEEQAAKPDTSEASSRIPIPPAPPSSIPAPPAPPFSGPPAPPAPPFQGPPPPPLPGGPLKGAPSLGQPKAPQGLQPLTDDQLHTLTPEQKQLSDAVFKKIIERLTRFFPANITLEPYKKYIENELSTLRKNESQFLQRAALDALLPKIRVKGALAELINNPQYPLNNISQFNATAEQYFAAWQALFKTCLFDTNDPSFDATVAWLVRALVGSSREIKLSQKSKLSQTESDALIMKLFSETDSVSDWIQQLLILITNETFLKPQGLLIPWTEQSQGGGLKEAVGGKPILQLLSEPIRQDQIGTIKKRLAQIVTKDLLFNEEYGALLESTQNVETALSTYARGSAKPTTTLPQNLADLIKKSLLSTMNIGDLLRILEAAQRSVKNNDLKSAIELVLKQPYKQQEIIQLLRQAGVAEPELTTIQTIFEAYKNQLLFLEKFHELKKIYEKEVAKPNKQHYKIGFELYTAIKNSIPQELKDVFESFIRTPELLLSAVTRYMQPLGRPIDKGITSENFNKMIEPYGILIKVLQQFAQTKNYDHLIELLTALNSGIIKDQDKGKQEKPGTENYLAIVTDNSSAITKGRIYVKRLDQALTALATYNINDFKTAIDTFIQAAGTVNQTTYEALMLEVKKAISQQALKAFIQIITDLNTGNYTELEGFETKNVPSFTLLESRVNALKTLIGLFNPVITLLNNKTIEELNLTTFKEAYENIINAETFAATLDSAQKEQLKNAVQKLFITIEDRIKKLL